MTLLLEVDVFFYQKTWIKENVSLLKSAACKDKEKSSSTK